MGTFVAYTFAAGIILLALYAVYKLLLERETFHRFNRIFVMSSYIISLTAGIFYLKTLHPQEISLPAMNIIYNNSYVIAPTAVDHTAHASHASAEWAIMAAIVLYGVGLLFFILRAIYTGYRIRCIIRKGVHSCTANDWRLGIHNDSKISPLPWHRLIILSHDEYKTSGDTLFHPPKKHL